MIWALLALLGVPIWLIVGVLAGALVSRRRFISQPGVFRMKLRASDAGGWPRLAGYGRVVNSVLVVNAGLALVRTSVCAVVDGGESTATEPVKPFDRPRVLDLEFEDGATARLAVDDSQFHLVEPLIQSSH